MSRITGFGAYGLCQGQTSPSWTSWPPYASIEGALVQGSGPEVYIVTDGLKRHVATSAAFNACGYHWDEISLVPDATLNLITTWASPVTGPPCPYTLVRQGSTSPVYVMDGSLTKRHVASSAAFSACRYKMGDVVSVPNLSGYLVGSPISDPPCPYVRDPGTTRPSWRAR